MTSAAKIQIIEVDYSNSSQTQQLLKLLDQYAKDPMGGGEPLPTSTRDNLISALAAVPNAFSLIAYSNEQPAGFTNCLQAFSTFKCKPLVNIHDLAVDANFRGQGIARQLLSRVDEIARERGCCKVTLEVLQGNHPAKAAYEKHGFETYELDPEMGIAEFWQKEL